MFRKPISTESLLNKVVILKNFITIISYTLIFSVIFIAICSYVAPNWLQIEATKAYIMGIIITALTITATLKMDKIISPLLSKSFKNQQRDYEAEIRRMQEENFILNNRYDTLAQIQQFETSCKSNMALQVMKVSKSGYMVKEEKLMPLMEMEDFRNDLPEQKLFQDRNSWWVFYSDNTRYEYQIGIKLFDIQYAIDSNTNTIYFKNVNLCRLDRIANTNHQTNQSNHIWIVKRNNNNVYEIINNPQHSRFKNNYKQYQESETKKVIEEKIDEMCNFYTEGLWNILSRRYNNKIHFITDREDLEWKSITEGLRTNINITTFMKDLYLTFDTMEICTQNYQVLYNALLPEQSDNQATQIE